MIYPRSPRAKWFPVTRLGTICVDNRMHAYASQAAPSSSISSLDDTGSLQNGGYFPNPRCSRRVIPSTAMILSVATLCPVAVNQRGLIYPSSKYFALFFFSLLAFWQTFSFFLFLHFPNLSHRILFAKAHVSQPSHRTHTLLFFSRYRRFIAVFWKHLHFAHKIQWQVFFSPPHRDDSDFLQW